MWLDTQCLTNYVAASCCLIAMCHRNTRRAFAPLSASLLAFVGDQCRRHAIAWLSLFQRWLSDPTRTTKEGLRLIHLVLLFEVIPIHPSIPSVGVRKAATACNVFHYAGRTVEVYATN